jgi:tetratricopeptide (TPR) repeat protein
MEKDIIDYLAKIDRVYVKIDNEIDLKIIHEILIQKCDIYSYINQDLNPLSYYFAIRYQVIENFDLMKQYYLIAIQHGNVNAMVNLGNYYQLYNNYNMTIKYYSMAIELGNAEAMTNLADYYKNRGDSIKMMKYYIMAICQGYSKAMVGLANYYCMQGNENDEMLKYYLMAIDKGNTTAMYNLGVYYKKKREYDSMIKYYSMGMQAGCSECINAFNTHLKEYSDIKLMTSFYSFLSDTNKQILNRTIINVMHITDHDIIANTMCIMCQELTSCVFLSCSHPICKNCFILPDSKCLICGRQ